MKPNINFIGTGKLGKTLAYLINEKNLGKILGVCNKSYQSSEASAKFLSNAVPYPSISELPPADITFITTTDEKIETAAVELSKSSLLKPGGIVLHCSGFLSSDCLQNLRQKGCYVASVHPMKSFIDTDLGLQSLERVFCAMEGNEIALIQLQSLFKDLGAVPYIIDKKFKSLYHLAGVFASNFVVTLFNNAYQLLIKSGIESAHAKAIVQKLMSGTIANLASSDDLKNALTGPIQRGDVFVVQEQLNLLQNEEKELYQSLVKSTVAISNLSPEKQQEILKLIENS